MKKRKTLCFILLFLTFSCSFLSLFSISANNESNYLASSNEKSEYLYQENKLRSSNAINTLNFSQIYQNASIIRRGFESVYFEVNVSILEHANRTKIEIYFPNNTKSKIEMNYRLTTNKNFTYEYKPKEDAPLGFHEVRFLVYNESMQELNTGTTYTNFSVTSTTWVHFNGSEYITEFIRGDYVRADIIFIENSDDFYWKVLVVNSTNELQQNVIVEFMQDPEYITFLINDDFDQVNFYYYIAINMTQDDWATWNVDYWGFYINNTNPIVYENSIVFNPTSVFRTEDCIVRLNVSDPETPLANISVTMELYDTNNNPPTSVLLDNNADGTFRGTFFVSANKPIGNYEAKFIATDLDSGIGYSQKIITIKNNPPDIDGYEINDFDTDERIFVDYGDDLEFDDFDVTDVEGIAYITIELILEDPIGDEEDEYEITREYEEDLDITIRTEDLSPGTWTVYVSVTDTDGAITDLDDDFDTGPQQIEIIPDLISDVLPWVMLIVGSFIGIITGIGFGYYAGKSRYIKYKPEEEKVPPKKKPKKVEKPVKEKVPPTKPKPVEKEIKEEPEKEEPKKPTPKRKIKRKL